MNWRQWMGVCKAKGYKRETLEAMLKDRPGFSSASLSKLSRSTEEADAQSIAFAWGLEVLPDAEQDFELYWRGLAGLGVEVPPGLLAKLGAAPPPPRVDARKIAEGLAPALDALLSAITGKLDTLGASLRAKLDAFALEAGAGLDRADAKLDTAQGKLDAVQAQLQHAATVASGCPASDEVALKLMDSLTRQAAVASGSGSLFDLFAQAVAGRMPHVPKLREARLARHLARHLNRLSGKRSAMAGAAGVVGACVVMLLWSAVSSRSQATCHQEPARAAEVTRTLQPVIILTSLNPGSEPLAFDLQALLGAITGQMGERVMDQAAPSQPLPGQKVPPCLEEATEVALNGGCWMHVDRQPPCGRYAFRIGGKCYRPMAAEPRNPVGPIPLAPAFQ